MRHCCSRGQRRTTQYPTDCGVVYSEVYAGAHTVLLPSVWSAVACGEDGFGQCNVCHQSGHHRLVVMAGWFFARLLCLLSPVPTVLRMISDVKGHDMKDHMVCNCALWWISMAVRTWLRLELDVILPILSILESWTLCTLMWQN